MSIVTRVHCPRCGWSGMELTARFAVGDGYHCPICYENGAGVHPVEAMDE